MAKLTPKLLNKLNRKARIRQVVKGNESRPRLSVFISLRHVQAQIINDQTGRTLAYASSQKLKVSGQTKTDIAELIGQEIAKQAKSIKIKRVVLDRGGRLYHGRIKALADAARSQGLEF